MNRTVLLEVLRWFVPEAELFAEEAFHGNINWMPEQLMMQALIWSAQLCWPKRQMNSGQPPLHLRLAKVKVGKTTMWLLTSIRRRLGRKQLVRYY